MLGSIPRHIQRQYRSFVDQFDAKNKTAERECVCYDAQVDWDTNVVSGHDSDEDTAPGIRARMRGQPPLQREGGRGYPNTHTLPYKHYHGLEQPYT
jgi:hypothetical protein